MLMIDEFYVGQRVITCTQDEYNRKLGRIVGKTSGNLYLVDIGLPVGYEFHDVELQPA